MDSPNLKRAVDILKLVHGSLSKEEFIEAFKALQSSVLAAEVKLLEKVHSALSRIEATTESNFAAVKRDVLKEISVALKEQKRGMDFIHDKVRRIKEGKDGKDGRNGKDGKDGARGPKGERGIRGERGPEGPQGKQGPKGEPGKDGKSAFGGKGVGLYIDGSRKLLTAQRINLIAGTNVTLTYNFANGRNDVTIDASGGGAFNILAATGTVNDSNTTFTFASAPTLVVVNGVAYRDTKGVSISGTTATLDYPPGTGGDVYGIG